jgi:hypothetical protein
MRRIVPTLLAIPSKFEKYLFFPDVDQNVRGIVTAQYSALLAYLIT